MAPVSIIISLFLVISAHVLQVLVEINVKPIIGHVKSILVGTTVFYLIIEQKRRNAFFIGLCNETSNTTYECLCQSGWTNINCETKINYCDNIKCLNNGICRSILLNFTCECLGTSYSGRYCEITAQAAAVHQVVSKSLWLCSNYLYISCCWILY